jgi:hypothetical protein
MRIGFVKGAAAGLALLLSISVLSCSKNRSAEVREIKSYPLDGLDGVIASQGVAFDPAVSSDGHGILKITASEPGTVELFQTGDVEVEDARLVYHARVRTADFAGQAYLEMWVDIPGKGRFFSRGLDQQVRGNVDWTGLDIPFSLEKGQNPDNVELNIVINGHGTVWVDELILAAGPL